MRHEACHSFFSVQMNEAWTSVKRNLCSIPKGMRDVSSHSESIIQAESGHMIVVGVILGVMSVPERKLRTQIIADISRGSRFV